MIEGAIAYESQRSYVEIESRVKGPPAIKVRVVGLDADACADEAARIYNKMRMQYSEVEGDEK